MTTYDFVKKKKKKKKKKKTLTENDVLKVNFVKRCFLNN